MFRGPVTAGQAIQAYPVPGAQPAQPQLSGAGLRQQPSWPSFVPQAQSSNSGQPSSRLHSSYSGAATQRAHYIPGAGSGQGSYVPPVVAVPVSGPASARGGWPGQSDGHYATAGSQQQQPQHQQDQQQQLLTRARSPIRPPRLSGQSSPAHPVHASPNAKQAPPATACSVPSGHRHPSPMGQRRVSPSPVAEEQRWASHGPGDSGVHGVPEVRRQVPVSVSANGISTLEPTACLAGGNFGQASQRDLRSRERPGMSKLGGSAQSSSSWRPHLQTSENCVHAEPVGEAQARGVSPSLARQSSRTGLQVSTSGTHIPCEAVTELDDWKHRIQSVLHKTQPQDEEPEKSRPESFEEDRQRRHDLASREARLAEREDALQAGREQLSEQRDALEKERQKLFASREEFQKEEKDLKSRRAQFEEEFRRKDEELRAMKIEMEEEMEAAAARNRAEEDRLKELKRQLDEKENRLQEASREASVLKPTKQLQRASPHGKENHSSQLLRELEEQRSRAHDIKHHRISDGSRGTPRQGLREDDRQISHRDSWSSEATIAAS
eukprot:TRINITY_DN3577_c0_g1_i1.p1 TRINITY_DN3577_c0_g1~~TRINITY_DN3577_c0_g1_i1.p1  ORF type:complete len:551 (+),score=137.30 TRINITY_DN3577_c0_g1_i1:77-1729(+)